MKEKLEGGTAPTPDDDFDIKKQQEEQRRILNERKPPPPLPTGPSPSDLFFKDYQKNQQQRLGAEKAERDLKEGRRSPGRLRYNSSGEEITEDFGTPDQARPWLKYGLSDTVTVSNRYGEQVTYTVAEYRDAVRNGELDSKEQNSAKIAGSEQGNEARGEQVKKAEKLANLPMWIDANGNYVKDPRKVTKTKAAGAGLQANASADDVPLMTDDGDDADSSAVKAGGYVYVGMEDVPGYKGIKRPVLMTTNDAKMQLGGQSPEDIAVIQEALGMPVTGIPDSKLRTLWDSAVTQAGRYAARNKNISVMDVFKSYVMGEVEDNANKGRGRGSGGGGSGGYQIDASYAKAALSRAMQESAGREPTDAEVQSFLPTLQAAFVNGQADPTQLALDWVRGNLSGETTGMATQTFMQSIMSLMGGGPGGMNG